MSDARARTDRPLTDEEWPTFRAWVRSRPAFRPDQAEGMIPEIGGAYHYGHKGHLQLPELVDKWRSLGRPEPRLARRRPQFPPGYKGGNGRVAREGRNGGRRP